jgi:subtilisin family serine protease
MSDSRDVFDEIFALLTPQSLLRHPRATGEGIAVCVVDSGMERVVLEERSRARGVAMRPIQGAIFTGTGSKPLPYGGRQSAPHGTTVADIILSLAPGVQLYSADVFGKQGSCDVESVIRALRWASDVWKCKVVNLSLGVPEARLPHVQKRYEFLRAVEEAYYQDVLVVAAAHNDHPVAQSFPAVFAPPLLSVDKNLFKDPLDFSYELRQHVEFQAHGRGYVGPFANEPATSWAAPHLTGIAARILSLRPELKPFEVKTILYWLCRHLPGSKQLPGTGPA